MELRLLPESVRAGWSSVAIADASGAVQQVAGERAGSGGPYLCLQISGQYGGRDANQMPPAPLLYTSRPSAMWKRRRG